MAFKGDFATLNRVNIINSIENNDLDLLIIGGGITGAGIALDAASRGLRTALIEMQDFSSGTSSRSTKLIHGGLRYLKQFEFKLVRAMGQERLLACKNAPHIVVPEKMLLPIVKGAHYGKLVTRIGLWLYDYLAGVKSSEKAVMLNKYEILEWEPLLTDNLMVGGALYYEYSTNDARLTIEILKKAFEHGALPVNYSEAIEFLYENNKAAGVKAKDLISGKEFTITASCVVNATGPWVEKLREKDNSLSGNRLHITKGVHITVLKERFPLKQSVYFDTDDNRMIFAIPKNNRVYIGTTDTSYKGNFENPRILKEDVDYLLDSVNKMFPSIALISGDIVSAWAGLRPLIHEEGKSPSEMSRRDEIINSPSGLITITGGKLTGYRLMAKKVTDLVMTILAEEKNMPFVNCKTETIPLSGGSFPFIANATKLQEFADQKFDEAKQTGVSVNRMMELFYSYGTNIDFLLEKAFNLYNNGNRQADQLWRKTELWYVVNHEMVTGLSDYFVRRTGMMHFRRSEILEILDLVTDELAVLLNWTESEKLKKKENFLKEYYETIAFL